ncbi:MAG: hypothetical protein LBN02_09935 [Oscillospiraceae bacterium]|jgi:hypothetical protein|nr:hypothetical protein [Oscillospiraceae bacterium]
MTPKFVRIQGRELAYRTGKPVGVFALAWRLIRDGVFDERETEIFNDIERWFNENLPDPPFYADENPGKPITYFKTATTAHMLDELAPILELFDQHGCAYDVVYTNFVGRIVYEDAYQVAVYAE